MTAHDTALAPAKSLDPVPPVAGKRFVDILEDLSTDADRIKNLIDVVYELICTDASPKAMAVMHSLEEFAEKHMNDCGVAVDEAMRRERLMEETPRQVQPAEISDDRSEILDWYVRHRELREDLHTAERRTNPDLASMEAISVELGQIGQKIYDTPARSFIDLACKVDYLAFYGGEPEYPDQKILFHEVRGIIARHEQ